MVSTAQSVYSNEQITAWLRGLLTIAWADGQYEPEEQELIGQLTQELALEEGQDVAYHSISPEELSESLGHDRNIAENFMRTAVLVAVADGIYSTPEAELLYQYSEALGLNLEALSALEHTLCRPDEDHPDHLDGEAPIVSPPKPNRDLLNPIKHWLDDMDVHDPRLARFICKLVPPQCPFERDIKLFGKKIVHIPALCELNPLYEQLVGLRFRALSYLADDCKEDISDFI